jgi:hypothetical protein
MQQPGTAFFTCSQCDAAYDSDALLRGHKMSAHRWSGAGQRLAEQGGARVKSSETQSNEQQNSPDHEGGAPNLS